MLVAFETKLVYPSPDPSSGDWSPKHLEFEDVTFNSSDGTALHGWYFPHGEPERTILFFHGNAEDVSDLGDEMSSLRSEFNANVFVFDYRGYGKSEGSPTETGVLQDGVAAQRWLAERAGIPADQIVLYGRSLGGGVAVANAATEGASALILDRTFHSMVDVAAGMYPIFPIRWLMRNRYPSYERITVYNGPLLQLHGTADEILPFESGEKLFAASRSKEKTFLRIEGLTHNVPPPPDLFSGMHRLFQTL